MVTRCHSSIAAMLQKQQAGTALLHRGFTGYPSSGYREVVRNEYLVVIIPV